MAARNPAEVTGSLPCLTAEPFLNCPSPERRPATAGIDHENRRRDQRPSPTAVNLCGGLHKSLNGKSNTKNQLYTFRKPLGLFVGLLNNWLENKKIQSSRKNKITIPLPLKQILWTFGVYSHRPLKKENVYQCRSRITWELKHKSFEGPLSCMTLAKSLSLSGPQVLHQETGITSQTQV